jgi:hypothetical protein
VHTGKERNIYRNLVAIQGEENDMPIVTEFEINFHLFHRTKFALRREQIWFNGTDENLGEDLND